MEFAVLAARIGSRRQVIQQLLIKGPAGEGAIELARIDAGQSGSQAGLDHVLREVGGGLGLPDREERLETGAGEPVLSILAHVFEEQVAERDVGESISNEAGDRRAHQRFVLFVRAWPWQWDDVQRQTSCLRLRFE